MIIRNPGEPNRINQQIDIPFHKNHGHRCAQAAIKSVLGARYPEKRFTFKELDELTLHQDPEITLPVQIAYCFHQLRVPFEYYVKPGGLAVAQSPRTQRLSQRNYGPGVTSNINFQALQKSAEAIQESGGIITAKDKPSIETLEKMVKQDKIPICLVNWDIFNGKPNTFAGHYIVLTGFENDEVIYHDNGPYQAGANKRVPKEKFQEAWSLSLMDHDLIVA